MPFDSQGETGETGETVETEVTEDDVECIVETVETVELEIKTESGNVEVSRFQVELTEERSLQKEGKKSGKNWRETETDPCNPVKSGSKHKISRGDTILMKTPAKCKQNRGNAGCADDAAEVGIRKKCKGEIGKRQGQVGGN